MTAIIGIIIYIVGFIMGFLIGIAAVYWVNQPVKKRRTYKTFNDSKNRKESI